MSRYRLAPNVPVGNPGIIAGYACLGSSDLLDDDGPDDCDRFDATPIIPEGIDHWAGHALCPTYLAWHTLLPDEPVGS